MNTQQDLQRPTLSLNGNRRVQIQKDLSGKPLDRNNGHEIILRSMIAKRQRITLTFVGGGECVTGRLSQFDKYTITIWPEDNDNKPETFYKHDIRSFTPAE